MKFKGKILMIIFFFTVLLLPLIIWHFNTPEILDIVIIDKTVPNQDFREHKALTWILGNQKITNINNNYYDVEKDYYGYFPENKEIRVFDLNEEYPDLIYIADTYGVYENDFNENPSSERSELVYGGLSLIEVELIKKAAYKGTTVIAEFNSFSSPTNEAAREQMYDLLGLRWTGWISRYFDNLTQSVEVPNWVVKNYEEQYDQKWNFNSSGFVFVDSNDQIVILSEKDISEEGVRFTWTNAGESLVGKKEKTNYNYWFDIVTPESKSEVLASYDLALKERGKEKLNVAGIPINFPAVIKNDTGLYETYYFAGDYADHSSIPSFYKIAGWTEFMERFLLNKDDRFFWKSYVPLMKNIIGEVQEPVNENKTSNRFLMPEDIQTDLMNEIQFISRTNKENIQIFKNNSWENFFIKGVNLGIAFPGRWFTNFPSEESVYLEWFEDIGNMNANTIRIYTLMHPSFYRALLRYNVSHPNQQLWLLQEIWPEEYPEDEDYFKKEYIYDFNKEIEYVVDAVHGNLKLDERKGRAYGDYDVDVSKYILGFLVGRELEPAEVISTNEKNTDIISFMGEYIEVSKGSPTEIWLAGSMDHLMAYQEINYQWQHPVAIVSWPTLDVLSHDAEWNEIGDKSKEYNDKVSIDIRNFDLGKKMTAGIFGAYHIYPNYPDFMNNTIEYAKYKDEEGIFRYGGYLEEFMTVHDKYPALVAEFGLATGFGNAHSNPDGYNHGGLSEKAQGEGIVRMMESIKREGYIGGVVFEWMDEWAKKTWTTEPFITPYEHNVFWHNVIDPEQNYGIQAMESIKPNQPQKIINASNQIQRLELSGDASYLYMDLISKEKIDLNKNRLLFGLDTYAPDKGKFSYNEKIDVKSPSGMEFLITLSQLESHLEVIPEYNISNYKFASVKESTGAFERINPLINSENISKDGFFIEEIRENGSQLNEGEWEGYPNHWYQEGNVIHLRIPWGRLSVTDPTTYQVLDDSRTFYTYPSRDTFETTTTDGFRITALLIDDKNKILDQLPDRFNTVPEAFIWDSWREPNYKKRLKISYSIIKDYFNRID